MVQNFIHCNFWIYCPGKVVEFNYSCCTDSTPHSKHVTALWLVCLPAGLKLKMMHFVHMVYLRIPYNKINSHIALCNTNWLVFLMEISDFLCCTGWTHFRLISQSIASHSRDPVTILGQSTWNLWWANRYSERSFSKSSFFSPVGIGNYLWWTLKTHLHCMLMTLCTQIWTCFITNSISLNKDQHRNAANVWREYFISMQQ